jgi:tRNA threonylcarbamoyladenosine biosynthesis protein TsaE
MPHLTFRTSSEDETIALGVALGRLLRPGDVLGLDGELGAGKTRLVRGIAEGLGLEPAQVSSPTYVLIHEYTLPLGSVPGVSGSAGASRFVESPLYHVDAYRLTGPDDLDSLGWERVMEGFGVVVIEWFERIAAGLQGEPSLGRVRIQHEPDSGRRIDLLAPASWPLRPEWRGVKLLADLTGSTGLAPGWAACPVTGRPVSPENPTFPFVDARARMADLGRWLTGQYLVSRELTEEDASDPDL